MAAGSIVVDLLLKTGSFETDTARASKSLKKFQKDAEAVGRAIGLAFTAGVAALGYMVKSSIDAADHLNDLSQKTGIAADTLGGIGFAAKNAGGDLESASAAAGKLNKSLAEAAAGNKQAQEAFTALGISVKDAAGNTKTADTALAEIATKFAGYADGPEKAALALRIFGKAGADIIPLLNGGGQALQDQIAYFKRYSGVTVETTKAADQFNDTLGALKLLSGAFAQNVAADLIVPLQAVADRLLQAKEKGDGFKTAAEGISQAFVGIVSGASFVIESLDAISTRLSALIERASVLNRTAAETRQNQSLFDKIRDPFGTAGLADKASAAFGAIGKVEEDEIAKAQKRHDRLVAALNFKVNPADYGNEGRTRAIKQVAAPRLPPAPGAGNADDPSKKLFENQLKALDAFIQQERDLLQTRNKFLEIYNSQGLLSIQSYFDSRTAIEKAAQSAEVEALDKEIALARQRIAKPGVSERDKADAQGKIEEAIRRRAKVEQQAGENALALGFQQEAAYKALADTILGLNAQVFDLAENFRLAAAVKFDLQFDALKKTFTAEGNAAGLEAITTLRNAALAQADFQKAALTTSRTTQDLADAETRLGLAQQSGAFGSLEALSKLGELRKAQIPVLEAQVAAEEAIAKASGNETLIRNAQAARLALDQLKASAEPLAVSLNKTFGDDFNSALDDFVTGTKSAADAFKSFAKSVLNDILKLGSKSITESLFSGSGGIGGALSSLFSSGSAQGGTSSAGGLISSFASLFAGFFADGGIIPPGKVGIVGERGPELAFGGTSGKTIANGSAARPVNLTQHFNFSQPQSRETQTQLGAAALSGAQRALARNG